MLVPEKDASSHRCPMRAAGDKGECLGSMCMAWRGATITFFAGGSAPAPEEIRAGFCGLAGIPPEVTQAQGLQLLGEIPAMIAMISSAGETKQ